MRKRVTESAPTIQMKTRPMSTVKLFVKLKDFHNVSTDVSNSGVKYYPIRRHSELINHSYTVGYTFEMDKNHPIVTFLVLKYGLAVLNTG